MGFDIGGELNKVFDRAIRHHEAKVLTTSRDWQALQDIEGRHDRVREAAEERYRDEYETRVERARSDIFSENTTPTHDLRPPIGSDRFEKDAIERQAHRRVGHDHAVMMARIDQSESHDIEGLMAEAAERRKLQGLAQDDFTQAADRRTGQDRRAVRLSQD